MEQACPGVRESPAPGGPALPEQPSLAPGMAAGTSAGSCAWAAQPSSSARPRDTASRTVIRSLPVLSGLI
ncbi:hypothetical protein NKH18_19420 [Streptomyces sp. M10(2022)]